MILHGKMVGEGPPTVLLHGLFGTSINFGTIQRRLSTGRQILALDLRNHGASPHDPAMTYPIMAEDVLETMAHYGIGQAALVGHSMGGKVSMHVALRAPERITRLLIADIAPVPYPPRYDGIARAMLGLKLEPGLNRIRADLALASAIPDPVMRAFLLQNLRLGAAPSWRIGLPEIAAALPDIEGWSAPPGRTYPGPTLVLRGEHSDYIKPEHRALFRALFPAVRFVTLRGAGHWLHADQPDAFTATLDGFLPKAQPA